MKRIIVFMLVLIFATAAAEEVDMRTFLAARGLTVFDEDLIAEMGGDTEAPDFDADVLCIQILDDSMPGIFVYLDGELLIGMDTLNMFSDSGNGNDTLKEAFIEACNAFDMQIYNVIVPSGSYVYSDEPGNAELIEESITCESLEELLSKMSDEMGA